METIWLRICAFALSVLMAIAPAGPGLTEAELRIAEGNIAELIAEGTPLTVEADSYSKYRFEEDDVVVPAGDGQLLVTFRHFEFPMYHPYLYSPETGEVRELAADENDLDAWLEILNYIKENQTDIFSYAQNRGINLEPETAAEACRSLFAIYSLIGDRYYASGNRLLVESARAGYFVVDTDTAVVHPFTNAMGFAADGRVICWEMISNEYTLVDADMNAESFRLNVPEEWHVIDLYPIQEGTVVLLREARVNMEAMEYAVGWADAQGEVTKIVSLGMFGTLRGPDTLVYMPEARAVVAWSPMLVRVLPAMIVREDAQEACVLQSKGSALEEVPLSEFLAASGKLSSVEKPTIFMGASKDGSCAMVMDYATPTVMLVDFATMNSAVLMSGEEAFEAMGTDPINVSQKQWDGGEYLYNRIGVLRLVPAA